jgi:hypothetical protein
VDVERTLLTQWTYYRSTLATAFPIPRMERVRGGARWGRQRPAQGRPRAPAERSRSARVLSFGGWRGGRRRSKAPDEVRKSIEPHLPGHTRAAPPCMPVRRERHPSYSAESTSYTYFLGLSEVSFVFPRKPISLGVLGAPMVEPLVPAVQDLRIGPNSPRFAGVPPERR